MNLHNLILTNNACYKAGKSITPKGIMVHSTGANNPWLKRYVGPDDGLLGKNQSSNHWNQDKPDDRQVCVHAFIGKLVNGTIATYQTLPWNHRGWHSGGTSNNTHIGFEICEDGLSDSTYFNKVYREAVELCVYLCKLYGLTEENILCHSEGYKQGIASNHADVMHWFPKHGESMDTFRAAVKAAINSAESNDIAIAVGDVVEIKETALKYYPGGQTIPSWVKQTYHNITQVEFNGEPVMMGAKRCVLLGKKIDKASRSETAGIMTWVDIDALNHISSIVKAPLESNTDPKYYRVQVGAFSKKENAENLLKELKEKGYSAIIKHD